MKALRTLALVALAAVLLTGWAGPAQEVTLEILSPREGAEVELETTIQGRVSDPRALVIVLVRPVKSRFWSVQRTPAPANRNGSWETLAYFGELDKGAGEQFEIIALVPEKRIEEGKIVEILPRHSAHSDVVRVRRTR